MTVYKGIYFDNYQLDDIAQRLTDRVYVSTDELDLFLCATSEIYNTLVNSCSSEELFDFVEKFQISQSNTRTTGE
jgi:hypothetical protein